MVLNKRKEDLLSLKPSSYLARARAQNENQFDLETRISLCSLKRDSKRC